jgi:2',3'-cyclic-nucleotide 2'-phosphodiesterase (5'-nucleotidase family)
MIPIMEYLGIDIACPGNHDYDFGIKHFKNLTSLIKTQPITWLMSNVVDPLTMKTIDPCIESYIKEVNNTKVRKINFKIKLIFR